MRNSIRLSAMALVLALAAIVLLSPAPTMAASKAEIDRNVKVALKKLYKNNMMAQTLGEKAKGILVFPAIYKGGLIVGGQYGDGALLKDGKTVGYYNTVAASYGLQAGGQKFGYAMFFMTDEALAYLEKSEGWEIGVGPSLVIVDKETAAAFGKTATSSTLQSDIYAFIFSQKGLMAGLGLQGSKITKINPK
jgi:lipid-binding SYLF domain-containing protein